ncbi:MAG TPA: hypothetical protein VHW70_01375 [Edaphobacter sp.]|nr:hypothetical protein [Edaphobacter sp.]
MVRIWNALGMGLAGLLAVWSGSVLAAQTIQVPQDGQVSTLHVYTNLIQIPTLVLGPALDQIKKPIAENKFSVSVDSGPWFRASHVRREEDDPISLAILLDMRWGEGDFIPKLRDSITDLTPSLLHARDHVSIYVLGCDLMRSLNDVPADTLHLRDGVDEALRFWSAQRTVVCLEQDHLWDALSYVAGQLYQLPGRRVILALSLGFDKGSKHTWNETRRYLEDTGVAVFGVSHSIPGVQIEQRELNLFGSVCESSGGLVSRATVPTFAAAVKTFVTMVRDRYIVEFPRPSNATPGPHDMRVKIDDHRVGLITAAGISLPVQDPAVLADPATVSAGPKDAPEMGTRKILTKSQLEP